MVINSKFKIPNAREVFRSLKNARSEWKSKTPMQKWCYFYAIGKAAFGAIRFPNMNDIHHVHWFAYGLLTLMTITTLLSIYSLIYYALRGELQMGLPSTCMASLFIGHYPTAIMCVSRDRLKLQSLIDFGGRYIYHDNHEKTEYNRICSDHMDRTMRQYIFKLKTIAVALSFVATTPMYAYMVNGIRSTSVETRIPFTEPKSDEEFIGNFYLHSLCGIYGSISYVGLEIFLSLLENVVTIAPRLIKSELIQTIKLYETKSITELELRRRIVNVVEQSNDTDNFVDSVSKLFYWRNLFTPVSFTYMVGMAIFSQYTMGYVCGYAMGLMSWTQLFFVCETGEKIQDNGFAEMLYQTKWEDLPVNIQKVIMLLIHRKQNEEGLRLGPFGQGINRETFKVSTNKIYTFVMFLRNFFE